MILFLCRPADHKNIKTLEHKNIRNIYTNACVFAHTGPSPAHCSQHRCIGLDHAMLATRLRPRRKRRRCRQRSKGLDHSAPTGLRSLSFNTRRRSQVEANHQQEHEGQEGCETKCQEEPDDEPETGGQSPQK